MNTHDLYKLFFEQQMNVIGFDSSRATIMFKNTTTNEMLMCSKTLAAMGYKNEIVALELLCFELRLLCFK